MRFFLAVVHEDWSIRACDEHGDEAPDHDALTRLLEALSEVKQNAYHEKCPDSGSVDFGEYVYETVPSNLHADRDTETRLGPFKASDLVILAERYSPKPWRGHPNYEAG